MAVCSSCIVSGETEWPLLFLGFKQITALKSSLLYKSVSGKSFSKVMDSNLDGNWRKVKPRTSCRLLKKRARDTRSILPSIYRSVVSVVHILLYIDNFIDGTEFFSLTRDDIVQFIDATGIIKKILRHIDSMKAKVTITSSYECFIIFCVVMHRRSL